jgi:ABC-type sugar transport system ATPase subunit
MKRINNIFNIKPDITGPIKGAALKPLRGNISFKNVSFNYELGSAAKKLIRENFLDFVDTPASSDNGWVLGNISFDIKAGMQAGIVGFTGSGKSTLVNLIPRLDDPQEGIIYIDGIDIKKYPLEHLRNSIGYVPQDAFLFSESIKDNIKFGKEDATDQEVIKAATLASVHENIIGFIYLITEVKTGIQYIGEKGFISFKTPKGKTNKQRFESNWKEYPTSNVVMSAHIKKSELERNEQFTFEILGLAKDKSVMKFFEAKMMMKYGALESGDFLNENLKLNILCSVKDYATRVVV